MESSKLPAGYLIREAAAEAESTYATVRRVLLGLPTKPIIRARIERVLKARGLIDDAPAANGEGR